MLHNHFFSKPLLSFALLFIAGCVFPPPTPPDPPLSEDEVKALVKCQESIKKEGAKFVNFKLKKLELCVDDVLELQLQLENGHLTPEKFEMKLAAVRKKCEKNFALITKASTKLVDGVVKACDPIETVLLGPYDPLRFQAVGDLFEGPFESVEEIAGLVCSGKELAVDAMVGLEVPRFCELLSILGPDFVIIDGEACLPNIPLDPRCPPLLDVPPVSILGSLGSMLR